MLTAARARPLVASMPVSVRSCRLSVTRRSSPPSSAAGATPTTLSASATDDDGQAVSGYLATTGYDRVTGLGTIDGPRFVPAIADATR